MKRIYPMLLALCLPIVFCGLANALHSGPYVGGLLGGGALMTAKSSDGLGDFSLEFDPALLGSAVAGWDFAPGNPVGEGRIELEYTHRNNTMTQVKFAEGSLKGDGNVTADSLLVNFWGVFHNKSPWSPYFGLGLGAARMEASELKVNGQKLANGSSSVLAFQAGTGVDFELINNLNLDLGYRFFGSTRPEFTEVNGRKFKMDYYTHNVLIGLRYGF